MGKNHFPWHTQSIPFSSQRQILLYVMLEQTHAGSHNIKLCHCGELSLYTEGIAVKKEPMNTIAAISMTHHFSALSFR